MNTTCPSLAASVFLSARFLIDVRISCNDLAQFFDINYFPLSELDHLCEIENTWRQRRPLVGMFMLSLGGSFIKAKLWSVPDVPAGGSVLYSSKMREGYERCTWMVSLLVVSDTALSTAGAGLLAPPGGRSCRTTRIKTILSQHTGMKSQFFIHPERQLGRNALQWSDRHINHSRRISK
jgi:hypothetical protein